MNTPRVLLMTATPHRGSEWLFRHLLHLVDRRSTPILARPEGELRPVKPGPVHFLRRMKEELVDYDGETGCSRAHGAQLPCHSTQSSSLLPGGDRHGGRVLPARSRSARQDGLRKRAASNPPRPGGDAPAPS